MAKCGFKSRTGHQRPEVCWQAGSGPGEGDQAARRSRFGVFSITPTTIAKIILNIIHPPMTGAPYHPPVAHR
jgi:hypothetical protein